MQTGYMYLMAIIDLHSRYVLKWSVSNTMAAEWCSRVLSETLASYPTPTFSIRIRAASSQPMSSLLCY